MPDGGKCAFCGKVFGEHGWSNSNCSVFTVQLPPDRTEPLSTYEGGATRSEMDVRFDLIPAEAMYALARRLALGAKKHGDENWKGGGAEFKKATINHLIKHLMDYQLNGNTTDNNTDAIICNAAFLAYFEARGI